ncbi:unnamed protein product [Candidula unifasciata]|uniref:Uncharacterized protein n=1 Tax=Candidula unifasciata TaxID=100452 RepID=A0A8S3ZHU9_9EUPU|nr:unnamed protein product [Candidula unifasciata]
MANESYLQMSRWENNNNSLREGYSNNNVLGENHINSFGKVCSNKDSWRESSCNKDSLEESCCSGNSLGESCGNNCQRFIEVNSNDKYTAAIELSNKCREFYQSRLQTANSMKSRWYNSSARQHDQVTCSNSSLSNSSSSSLSSDVDDTTRGNRRQRHRIDEAMEKLRKEMVSLMDQDLSLMKQLLTLNETIEDLKWQQQYYSYSTSWASSSASKYLDSNLSVSDTQMYDSGDDVVSAQNTFCLTTHSEQPMNSRWYHKNNLRKGPADLDTVSVDPKKISSLTDTAITSVCSGKSFETIYKLVSRPESQASSEIASLHPESENSFDSGIHESTSGDELTWSV